MTLDFEPLLRALLKPLVRLAIASGITFQVFGRLLRQTYFDVAQDFEPVRGKPNSDSRISVLTGLPRREVRLLRDSAALREPPPLSLERLVLDRWSSRLDLHDASGNKLPLPRTLRRGGDQSFEALVASVSTDVRPRSMLDEWLRKGHVVLDEEDRVVLTHVQPPGIEGTAGASAVFAHLVQDLLRGFEHRYVAGQPTPGYAFHVIYGHRLTDASAALVCRQAEADALKMAQALNRLVLEREALDRQRPDARRRVTFGFGVYQADQLSEPGLLDAESARADAPPLATTPRPR